VAQIGLHYAFMAIAEAYLGNDAEAKATSSSVLRLEPRWSTEESISSQGGFARDKESNLFAKGAKRAGLPMCASDIRLNEQPNMLRLNICDPQRGASSGIGRYG
jgi:hypothetical protein